MNYILLTVSIVATTHSAAFAEQFVYTPTRGPTCIDRSKPSLNAKICAGPAGFAVVFSDEGNLASFGIRYPGERRARLPYVWRGAGKDFGNLVEWRIDGKQPTHAVLRIWRSMTEDDGTERIATELLVFRIKLSGYCLIGSLDARRPNANLAAHETMIEPERPCLNAD